MTEDAEIEVVAETVENLLHLLPMNMRAQVLARATEKQAKREQERPVFTSCSWVEPCSSQLYWHDIMQFKAKVAYTFIRSVTNNHSPEDASRILFSRQWPAPGSGYLSEYLRNLGKFPHRYK
jgi:hypothetical protein